MKLSFLRHLFTEDDNETFDIGRTLWAAGVLVFLFLAVYSVVQRPDHTFDAQAYGIALAAVLGAGGGMVTWMRHGKQTPEAGTQDGG